MIKKRIIPCLDVKNGRVVKGVNFAGLQDVSSPMELAKFYSDNGADELVFYDITASAEGRALFADILTLKESLEFDKHVNSEKDYQLTSCCCPMWIAMIKKIYNEEEYTQQEIAECLGISRSYVSRIEKSAIEKLRRYF